MQKPIRIEVDPEDYTNEYDDMLDDCYGEFMNMNASYILKECDPTAYRCGLLNFVDGYADDMWACPICDFIFKDEDDAMYCCQQEDDEERKEENKNDDI